MFSDLFVFVEYEDFDNEVLFNSSVQGYCFETTYTLIVLLNDMLVTNWIKIQGPCSLNRSTNSKVEVFKFIQGQQHDKIIVVVNANHEANNPMRFISYNYIHMTRHNTIDGHET